MRPEYKKNYWDDDDNNVPPEAIRFHYYWRYIPNDETGERYVYCLSELIFYMLLNKWNAYTVPYDDCWRYWANG